jgi:hypothetical protein
MKASPIITIYYRNSICTITAVQMTLTYVIEITYSRGTAKYGGVVVHAPYLTIYSQCSQSKLVHWQHLK